MINNDFTGVQYSNRFTVGARIESLLEFSKLPYNTNIIVVTEFNNRLAVTNAGFINMSAFLHVNRRIISGRFFYAVDHKEKQ